MSGRSFAISHERASPAECYAIWKAGLRKVLTRVPGNTQLGFWHFEPNLDLCRPLGSVRLSNGSCRTADSQTGA
jgi:hypothetical protein